MATTKATVIMVKIALIATIIIIVFAMPLPRNSPSDSSISLRPFKARKKPIIVAMPTKGKRELRINPPKNRMAAHFTCGS